MENLIAVASEHGVLALVIFASFWFINKLTQDDSEEKKHTIQILLDTNKTILEVVERNTRAFIELKEAIKKN